MYISGIAKPQHEIRTYIGGDFAGSNYPLAFRLRHAYGQIGFWTLGHTWSTFADLVAITGMVYLWYPVDQPDDSFRSSYFGSVNAFWEPIEILRFGTELTVGKRTNYNRQSGTAVRLQFAAIFYF